MITNLAYLIYDFGIESFALIGSRMHVVWVRAVSGRFGSGIRYTPTVSYHTFPVPALSEQNKAELTRCHRRQPADGAGARAAFRVQSEASKQ